MPTTSATTTVRGRSTSSLALRSSPIRLKSNLIPTASTKPIAMPTADPTRPTTPASASTDRAT
jgi:hypothetical protein